MNNEYNSNTINLRSGLIIIIIIISTGLSSPGFDHRLIEGKQQKGSITNKCNFPQGEQSISEIIAIHNLFDFHPH